MSVISGSPLPHLNAMVLTAGLGTRLAPYTKKLAKPAIPFIGVPLLCHALRPLDSLKITNLVLNLHHRPDDIRNVAKLIRDKYHVHFSDESTGILGSGGAITQARKWLETEDHFVVVNGDEIFIPSTDEFMETAFRFHLNSGNLCTVITMDHPEVGKKFGGAWVDADHRVVKFAKKPVEHTQGLHYVGYAFFSKKVFNYCTTPPKEENLLYDILMRALIAGERVYAFKTAAHWFEVGNPIDFVRATEKMIALFEKNTSSDLSRSFGRFLRKHQPWSVMIENDFEPTLKKVNKLLDFVKR